MKELFNKKTEKQKCEDVSIVGEIAIVKELWNYTLKESQLRAYILGKIDTISYKNNSLENYKIKISKKEVLEFLGLKANDLNRLKNLLRSLRKKDIEIITNEWITDDGFISKFITNKYNDNIIICLNKDLVGYFFSKRYVKYYSYVVKHFKNKYSLGFYELLKFKKGDRNYITWEVDLEDIYIKFNINDTYKSNFSLFFKKIIEPVIKDVNRNTDIIIRTEGKKSKNALSITFTIRTNHNFINKLKTKESNVNGVKEIRRNNQIIYS